MAVRTYDPKRVVVLVSGIVISGFADGTFVSVERSNDAFTKVSGADGVVSRAKSNDLSGSMTITLAQTSPSNDILSGIAQLDAASNAGVVPIAVTDFGGRTALVSGFAWVKKVPTVEEGKEINNREWVLDCADLNFFVGGNPDNE